MTTDAYSIRVARADELERLSKLEDAAGAMYGEVGIDPDLPGLTRDELGDSQRAGLLWVIADAADTPVGFALCQRKPGALHLRELDVDRRTCARGSDGASSNTFAARLRARGCRR